MLLTHIPLSKPIMQHQCQVVIQHQRQVVCAATTAVTTMVGQMLKTPTPMTLCCMLWTCLKLLRLSFQSKSAFIRLLLHPCLIRWKRSLLIQHSVHCTLLLLLWTFFQQDCAVLEELLLVWSVFSCTCYCHPFTCTNNSFSTTINKSSQPGSNQCTGKWKWWSWRTYCLHPGRTWIPHGVSHDQRRNRAILQHAGKPPSI